MSGEQVTLELEKPVTKNAVECVREFGTPVRLLEAYYHRLGVKLVIMNGSRCAQIWEPPNWASRGRDDKVTVVLNVWNDHVSMYAPDVGNDIPSEVGTREWPGVLLVTAKADDDEHRYDDMRELDWCDLLEAWLEKRKGVVFWTTAPIKELETGLHTHDFAFIPHYMAPGE